MIKAAAMPLKFFRTASAVRSARSPLLLFNALTMKLFGLRYETWSSRRRSMSGRRHLTGLSMRYPDKAGNKVQQILLRTKSLLSL